MGNRSSLDNLVAVTPSDCDNCLDGSCHCKVAETSIILISIISSVLILNHYGCKRVNYEPYLCWKKTDVSSLNEGVLQACLIDLFTINHEKHLPRCSMKENVESMRTVLVTLFQVANISLLLATLLESSSLVNLYVCFTLGFVPMALLLAIIEMLSRTRREGVAQAFLSFIPEVVFIFVISRCLPMVNAYRKYLFNVRK